MDSRREKSAERNEGQAVRKLKLHYAPEPATATLSLPALAAPASRRKRA